MRARLDQTARGDAETVREVSNAGMELRQRESAGGENDCETEADRGREGARDRETKGTAGRSSAVFRMPGVWGDWRNAPEEMLEEVTP